ncbi:hypothetical protein AGMMS50218_08910 [Actinomycetota bacterium]|nr:hypothetical protein AGMMS50218_08910 [Actinomycetota bacterium]
MSVRAKSAPMLQFKDNLMHRLEVGVDELVAHHSPALNMDPSALAEQMLAVVPRSHVYDKELGPFHTTDGVRHLLGGVSRQAVFDRVRRGTLLQVRTADGVSLYPAFQFEGAEVSPRLRDVLVQFRSVPVDGWAVGAWLVAPAEDLGGVAPRAWLSDPGNPVEPVARLAAQTAARWSMP